MHTHSTRLGKLLTGTFASLVVHGTAAAQTNVTVSGLVDGYVGRLRYSGDTANRAVVNSSGMTTSWFGVKGSEDLGGGLTARFGLTGFFKTDTGASGRFANDTFWSRDANVALSGGFGTIQLGRGLAPNFVPSVISNAFGDSFSFSPLILHMDVPLFNASGWTNSVQGDTGWSNGFIYTTPKFGDLNANIHYQFGEVAGDNSKRNVGANVFYFSGPYALTGFYHNIKVNNPLNSPVGNVQPAGNIPLPSGLFASRQTAWMVGGNYNLTAVKLFASYGQTSHDIDLEDKTLSLGASVPAGSGRFLAAWAQTKRSGAAVVTDRKRNTASLGYVHDMSKRTDVYAVMMNDKITAQRAGTSFGLGMRHRF
jgi:predicted porin